MPSGISNKEKAKVREQFALGQVTRETLLERVWGDWYGDTHVVEVHMSRLRNKVKKAGGPSIGTAVRGVGYRLGLD